MEIRDNTLLCQLKLLFVTKRAFNLQQHRQKYIIQKVEFQHFMFHCTASCRHLAGFYYFYRQICQRGEKTILYCHPTAIQPAMPIAKDCYGLCSAASGEARGSAAHRFCRGDLFSRLV